MLDSAHRGTAYRFGLYEVYAESRELFKQGRLIRLQEQPFKLLLLLVERPGEVVSRESVRQHLWPQNTFVEFDRSLATALTKLRQALGDEADNPRFIETIPRRGYRFLAPVSVVAPSQNRSLPPASSSVDADLPVASEPANSSPPAVKGSSLKEISRWKPGYWAAAAGVSLLLCAAAGWLFLQHRPAPSSERTEDAPPVHSRRSVAVLGFRNLPGRPGDDWLSAAFTEMLNTELAAGGQVRLVSEEDVARAKRELLLPDRETLARDTLARLHANPGADVIVLGSFTPLQEHGHGQIRLDIRLQDTASGETIAEEAFIGQEEHLFDLTTQAGARLRQVLRIDPISAVTAGDVRASLPSNQQAARLYAEGRAKLWDYDFQSARDLLIKAVDADPNYPLSHSALSNALAQLGYDAAALKESRRALDLAQHLPQQERLLTEGEYWQTTQDWPRAVEIYEKVFQLYPDSLDNGLRLASSQIHVKPEDGLRTLALLRRLPLPAGDDPRIDMHEASAWVTLDFANARLAADHAIEKASARGSHFLVARTYAILCQQLAYTGASTDEAIADCERARQSYVAAGHHNGAARTLNDLAIIYAQQGDLARAMAMWREALQTFRQGGDVQGAAGALNNLGEALLLQGKLAEASKVLEEALPGYRTVEDKDGMGRVLNDLGDLLWEEGNLQAARTTYQQSIATAQEINDKSVIAVALTGLGHVLSDEGDLPAARKDFENALTLQNQLDEKQPAAETQVALAQLSIEEGRAADAEGMVRRCQQQFQQERQVDDELSASVVLTRSLVAQGKNAEAQAQIKGLATMAVKCQRRLPRFQYALTLSRVLIASGDLAAGREQLEQVMQQATALGFTSMRFEAQLALAECEAKSGNIAAARANLHALEKAARGKGFALVARKAVAAGG